MIQFLISLIPVCLGIWGLHILFQEGHLLDIVGDKLRGTYEDEGTWREHWTKPIFDCPICMSSIWGIIGFFAIRYFFNVDLPIKQIVPFLFCLCGLNTIISKLTSKERVITEE